MYNSKNNQMSLKTLNNAIRALYIHFIYFFFYSLYRKKKKRKEWISGFVPKSLIAKKKTTRRFQLLSRISTRVRHEKSTIGSLKFKLYRDRPNSPSLYVSWIKRSMVTTFGERAFDCGPFRILLPLCVHRSATTRFRKVGASPFLFPSNVDCRERRERHERENGSATAAAGHASSNSVGEKGTRGRSEKGIATLPEERVARERRDTRCAPPRRRSVAFGQLRGSSAVDRANTAAPQPSLGGGGDRERMGRRKGVVGDEDGCMWARCRWTSGAKEEKREEPRRERREGGNGSTKGREIHPRNGIS